MSIHGQDVYSPLGDAQRAAELRPTMGSTAGTAPVAVGVPHTQLSYLRSIPLDVPGSTSLASQQQQQQLQLHQQKAARLSSSSSSIYFNYEDEEDMLVFVESPSKKLHCPLCHRIFCDPVITTCGHTFCKRCVDRNGSSAFADEVCPIDGKPSKFIVANIALSEQIGELVVHCKHGCRLGPDGRTRVVDDTGCPVTLKYSERQAHERECDFALMQCPNNPACPAFRKKDLSVHLKTCSSVHCPHAKHGCAYSGTQQDLRRHLETCKYEGLKDFLQKAEERTRELAYAVQLKQEDVDFLRSSLSTLSGRVEELEDQLSEQQKKMDRIIRDLEDGRKERDALSEELASLSKAILGGQYQAPFDPQPIIKCKGTFVGHQGPVWCLCVNLDYLFSGSSDMTIKVWDTSTNYKCIKTLEGHTGIVLALAVYGSRLYSGSQDTKMMVWNMETYACEKVLEAHDNPVCTLAAAKGMVFSGSLKAVKVWDAQTLTLKKELSGFRHWVRALFATDKEVYCGSYQTITIFPLDKLEPVRTLETSGGSVYSICATDRHILCGTYENVIQVWEAGTYDVVTTLQGHSGTVYALAWMHSPAGTVAFSASYDRSIRVWSMDNMICRQTLIRHAGSVACLAVSKGRLFSGAVDSTVKVWQ